MKKLIGIFIVMLLIGTAIPSFGMISEVYSTYKIIDDIDCDYAPNEIIVKFKNSPTLYESIDIINKDNQVISMEKAFDDVEGTSLDNIYYLKIPEHLDTKSVVNEYASLPFVEYAEPNDIRYVDVIDIFSKEDIEPNRDYSCFNTNPDDPLFNHQWALENTGQYEGDPDCDIDAPESWDIEKGSEDVVIAIIDSGVDYTHPDLADNIWINDDEIPNNKVDDDNNGYVDDYHGYDFSLDKLMVPLDVVGHGTFCAGIVSAVTNNGIGMSGVCWKSKIMCIKVFNENSAMYMRECVKALKYSVDNGADILSISLAMADSPVLEDGFIYAFDKGAVLIAAAGNYNTSDNKYIYPAAYDYTIGVSATNQHDERCDPEDWGYLEDGSPLGSNFGEWVDVAAPGNDIYSTMPTYHVVYNDLGIDYNYAFVDGGGTSWATPHVAGIAALLLSQEPTLTNEEVRKIIRANVDSYNSEEYIGTGRVNAYKALTRFNAQPDKPIINGPVKGKPNKEYTFSASCTDPDGDTISYMWDWGDGNLSEWLDSNKASYTWEHEAKFNITVMVKDIHGAESEWSDSFVFSTPKNKEINEFPLIIQKLIERFPTLERLI